MGDGKQDNKEHREDSIMDDDVKMAGELFVRFLDEDGNAFVKHSSGHIVKKDPTSGFFIMLTARTNLQYKTEDDLYHAKDGFYFLQRKGQDDYTARFRFTDAHIDHFLKADLDYEDIDKFNVEGSNLSAIVLKKWVKKVDIAEVPDLLEDFDIDEDIDATISGYPSSKKFSLYSHTSTVDTDHVKDKVI